MDTILDPPNAFPAFYANPVIRALAGAVRWTVSGRLGDDLGSKSKAPIDMRALLDLGRVRGAWQIDKTCLVTLEEMTSRLPNAANAAYYLQAQVDGVMVIDIEPCCPPEIAQGLLTLPGILYSEVSMSGRGYHLVTALPENFHAHGVAAEKRVLREEHGWYEILLDHWVTFTRRPIGEGVVTGAQTVGSALPRFDSIEDLYSSLAVKAKKLRSLPATAEWSTVEGPDIESGRHIIELTLQGSRPRLKHLDDFDGDHSRWEFSILGTLFREMRQHLVLAGFMRRVTYTPADQAWLLYRAAQEVIPARPKHLERRNNRPFLLDRAASMVATATVA
ncbi:hypothetical protein QFZ53_002799 [Microbacterium natoriense]|uniref:DNA primase/polymerase bifunctional N-terminal domain-containing protein n=1 Tax=Microbacterium natoriense TaxID=284570 RepID=A0AAW8EZ54_9MICO|nr:hypothetical protein [Microbacterium natoriense]MDQ0648603.1 hypothetical protein [Microbacterium natoriense]